MLNIGNLDDTEGEKLPDIDRNARETQNGHDGTEERSNVHNTVEFRPLVTKPPQKKAFLTKKGTMNMEKLNFKDKRNKSPDGILNININKGFATHRDTQLERRTLPGAKNREQSNIEKSKSARMRVTRFRKAPKVKKIQEYNHPMSKWMHIAYASPKPASSRVYKEVLNNYNKVAYEENKQVNPKVIEKEVPFQIACHQHAHLLAGCSKLKDYDSLQEKRKSI